MKYNTKYNTISSSDLLQFIRNIWKFRKALWNHRWYDYSGTLQFIEVGIADMATNVEVKGIEVERSRMKKVAKMKRAVEILKNIREHRYFDIVEVELGRGLRKNVFEVVPCEDKPGFYKLANNVSEEERSFEDAYFDRAYELEQQEWNELWEILKGQDSSTFDKDKKFDDQFDGSGLQGWWD